VALSPLAVSALRSPGSSSLLIVSRMCASGSTAYTLVVCFRRAGARPLDAGLGKRFFPFATSAIRARLIFSICLDCALQTQESATASSVLGSEEAALVAFTWIPVSVSRSLSMVLSALLAQLTISAFFDREFQSKITS
jgi:hypothetical protein